MSDWQVNVDKITYKRIEGLARALDTTVELLTHDLLQWGFTAHNQTEESWIEDIDEQTLGTGIFFIPDVTKSEIGAVQGVVVPDITYTDCARRGRAAIVFKWIPHKVLTYEDLMKST